jgi:hypothetical protein
MRVHNLSGDVPRLQRVVIDAGVMLTTVCRPGKSAPCWSGTTVARRRPPWNQPELVDQRFTPVHHPIVFCRRNAAMVGGEIEIMRLIAAGITMC